MQRLRTSIRDALGALVGNIIIGFPGAGRVAGIIRRLRELGFAYFDSRWGVTASTQILFLDLGSNTGQAFSVFSKIFLHGNVTFELFEPNPNCKEPLSRLADMSSAQVTIHQAAAGTDDREALLFGLAESEGGLISQGASILPNHNSSIYSSSYDAAVEVQVVDFSRFLKERSRGADLVVVKMDIEGAEVDLLRKLLDEGTIGLINVLYVEFHSAYFKGIESERVRKEERKIEEELRKVKSLRLRRWH